MMRTIHFTLPLLLPTRNEQDRMHFHEKTKLKERLAMEIRACGFVRPINPLPLCAVTVWRHSLVEPDTDGLFGSLKQLLDVLQPQGALIAIKGKTQFRNPQGIGIIADDRPSACDVRAYWIKARHRTDQKTVVVIRELSEMPERTAA